MRLNLVNPQRAVDHGQQVRPVLAAPSLSCLITKFDSDHHQDDDYDYIMILMIMTIIRNMMITWITMITMNMMSMIQSWQWRVRAT